MPLCLVLHELELSSPMAEQAFFAAVFEVAAEHLRLTEDATLVATGVSPGYLLDHLRHAARKAGVGVRVLLVTEVTPGTVAHGLPPEADAWLKDMLLA